MNLLHKVSGEAEMSGVIAVCSSGASGCCRRANTNRRNRCVRNDSLRTRHRCQDVLISCDSWSRRGLRRIITVTRVITEHAMCTWCKCRHVFDVVTSGRPTSRNPLWHCLSIYQPSKYQIMVELFFSCLSHLYLKGTMYSYNINVTMWCSEPDCSYTANVHL